MSLELSDDQRIAIDSTGTPLRIADSRTGRMYVLVSEDAFARLQLLVNDELAETYAAQMESAMRAGWNDPEMDQYNEYDRHRAP